MHARVSGSVAAFLLAAAIAPQASAATFDEKTGNVRLEEGLVLRQSLDGAGALADLPARVLGAKTQQGYTQFSASGDALEFVGAALEGAGALRVRGDRAVLLGDPTSLAALAAGRVEVRVFARAEGAMPQLRVIYARKAPSVEELAFPIGMVPAVRTGRATSDGWVEYTTGPIDGTVLDAPIAGLLLTASVPGRAGAAFLVDALEVRRVAEQALSVGDCHVASEAKDCQNGAVCMEGKCVDGALAYGALPPEPTRRDVAARAAMVLGRFQNDRHAAAAAGNLAPKLAATAMWADTPVAFYRPYLTAIGALRGAHTGPSAPTPYSRLALGATTFLRYSANELNACFGVVERDVSGGGRGYAVYAAASPSPLAVGDVVDTVDGEPVDAWIARHAAEHGLLTADPDSDRPTAAMMLTGIVLRFGRELAVTRCTPGGACGPVSIDLATVRKSAATVALQPMRCSPRFHLAVNAPAGVDMDAYEAVVFETDAAGNATLHTNGEPWTNNDAWVRTVTQAFGAAAGGRMLVDKRRGDGGGGAALEAWGRHLRRGSAHGLFWVDRIDHAAIDGAPGFLAELLGGCDGSTRAGKCMYSRFESFPPAPGSAPAKVAWLTVLDGSASDMSTFYAKGGVGVRIFGPNRTVGLFGGLGTMGALLDGWGPGAVQLGDIREGDTPAERLAGRFRSGRGIEPDEIVVQKQSDLVEGRDTMLDRARAWLSEP